MTFHIHLEKRSFIHLKVYFLAVISVLFQRDNTLPRHYCAIIHSPPRSKGCPIPKLLCRLLTLLSILIDRQLKLMGDVNADSATILLDLNRLLNLSPLSLIGNGERSHLVFRMGSKHLSYHQA